MTLGFRGFSRLLAGTSLAALPSIAIAQATGQPMPTEEAQEQPAASDEDDAIVVTGTRIRGARAISETVTLERDTIVEAGQIDLGEAIRSLPQNFSGGQNPGIGQGAGLLNSNVNSASNANLRGLGPDATLTLLNGQRLPYDSALAGVDISAIPLAAVERVEVLPDGASALYGSDAVAGVVNVILRRDFEGVETSAQIGTSTDGGYFRQQADIIAGTVWDEGNAFIAYDFLNNSDVAAGQRSYASGLDPEATLFPSQERHAVTLSVQHQFAPGVEAKLVGLYSNRISQTIIASPTFRSTATPEVESFTLAPSLEIELGADWQATLAGVFGRDRTRIRAELGSPGATPSITQGCFCNELSSFEAGLEGPLVMLPGGEARLAVGAGIRTNTLENTRIEGGNQVIAFDEEQRASFIYGELYLPVIGSTNAVPGIAELSLSAAARHEDYRDLDRQTTPRIGLSYAPVDGVRIRGSWSRSFKAPTLFQRFVPYQTILLPASIFGAGSAPETVFYTSGGNPDVTSERARTWTAGIEFRPTSVPELLISATWYDIRYRDRVVRPIAGSIVAGFRNPGFASLIDFSPDAGFLDGLIANSLFGLENFSGSAYDPNNVVAYFDNRNRNVAVWAIEGLDARIGWNQELGGDRSITVDLAGSFIDSEQQLTPDLAAVPLSGTAFNPPRYRGRGSVSYQSDRLGVNLAINYIGSLVDRRFADARRLSPSAIVDFGLSYAIVGQRGREPGLELSLNIQNLFDDEPEAIDQIAPTDTPYESTNYSPLGRFISIGIRRHW